MTDGMMVFICEHEAECSKPDRFAVYAQYLELWASTGLVAVIPDDSEPSGFTCTECGATATLEAAKGTKKQRKNEADQAVMRL